MTVNQLIAELQKIAETHGEMECLLETHTDEGLRLILQDYESSKECQSWD